MAGRRGVEAGRVDRARGEPGSPGSVRTAHADVDESPATGRQYTARRLARDDRLGAVALVATADAVELQSGQEAHGLKRRVAGRRIECGDTKELAVLLRVGAESGELFARAGLLREIYRPWTAYFTPDFHPRQQDDSLSARWLDQHTQDYSVVGR